MGDSTPAELMALHIAALFTHDDRGRIVGINQWNGGAAPRFFLGRTRDRVAWRVRADLPRTLVDSLETLCRTEPCPSCLEARPVHYDRYLELLERHAPIERMWSGPAYWLQGDVAPAATTVVIDESNAALLCGGLDDWLPDIPHRRPMLAQVSGGRAIAICASVRITAAAHEAGVETVPAYRRAGHGAVVVASWAHAVRQLGALPLYSTSWDNAASQRLAARLRFSLYGCDFHIS